MRVGQRKRNSLRALYTRPRDDARLLTLAVLYRHYLQKMAEFP